MKYIVQIIIIVFAFIICNREKIKFSKAINDKLYDFGMYKFSPLLGDDAIKMARRGIYLATAIPWMFIIVFIIYDIIK